MVDPLVVVGAGGFAREVAAVVAALNDLSPRWELLGFADDDARTHGQVRGGVPVIGPADIVHELPDARVVVCMGNPKNYVSRKQVVDRLGLPRERYATIVHPLATHGPTVTIGAGTVILAGVAATADISIGDHVAVMPNTTLTHDDVVGDYCTLAANVAIAGGVILEVGAYLGAGCTVNAYLTVGAWALVGLGSVVLDDIPPGEVWAGVPARRLRSSHAGRS